MEQFVLHSAKSVHCSQFGWCAGGRRFANDETKWNRPRSIPDINRSTFSTISSTPAKIRPKLLFLHGTIKKSPAWTTVQQQPREKIRLPRFLGNNGLRKTGDINGNFFCHAKGIKKIEKLSRGTNVQNKDTNESIQLKEYCFLFFFY